MSPESMLAHIDDLSRKNSSLQGEVVKLRSELTLLAAQLEWFKRQVFGQKRERYIAQDSHMFLDLGVQTSPVEAKESTIPAHTRKSRTNAALGHGRDQLPAHLPRVKKYIKPDYDTRGMQHLRDNITEELHYKAPQFYVLQIIRPVHVKIDEAGLRTPLCPPLPPRCIEKGIAGASMVAQTIVTKVVDHNPLYRFQKQIKRASGYAMPYATLNDCFARGVFWLEPIAARLHELILAQGYMQMDETGMRVLIQQKKGKSHKGYMIVCNAPQIKAVSFHYFNTRNQKIVRELLGLDYRGIVQTDGLDIYDFLNTLPHIVHAGCHAHARRGFEEAKDCERELAAFALDKWQKLFEIEEEAVRRGLSAEQRLLLRTERSAPLIEELRCWINATLPSLTPQNPIAKAMNYVLNRWRELTRFLEDGRIELSDNLVENRIRPHALGRKNWLFSKTQDGARRLAVASTVLRTCELYGHNPFAYLCDVLEKMPARKANDIDDLLPMNWVAPQIEI
jgi:transposase